MFTGLVVVQLLQPIENRREKLKFPSVDARFTTYLYHI